MRALRSLLDAGSPVATLLVSILAGAASGLAFWLIVVLGNVGPPPGPVHEGGWVNRERAWLAHRGFHHTEFDQDGERPYNWTSGSVRLQIPNLDRSRPYRLVLDVEHPRPADLAPARVSWTVDGTPAGERSVAASTDALSILLPTSSRTRAVVTMTIAPTFDPGPDDDRQLGIVVRRIALVAERGWRPTWAVLAWLSAAVALTVAGILLCGLPPGGWVVVTGVVPMAFVWLTLQDAAFLGDYPLSLLRIGTVTGAIGAIVAVCRTLRSKMATVPPWAAAVGLVLGASVVKLAFFTHPQVTIGDGIFQVHRAGLVEQGQYFFTSVTPRPFFEFPYAVALFVAAMPFWDAFSRNVDHVWLLRTLALVADALVGVALYGVVSRLWGKPRVALLAAGLWPFARAPLEALCNANLPNVFGQGVFGVAMAGLVWSLASGRPAWLPYLLATLTLALALLSHFSTFSVGVPIVGVVALAVLVGGGAPGRRQGAWIIIAGAIALTLAYATYYRHFGEVYQATIDRVLSEEVTEEPGSAIAATPAVKFRRWITGTSDDYGLPGTAAGIMAGVGFFLILRERRRDPWSIALHGWLLVWVAFTAIGILTAVQMRINLAAAPVFVCLAAYGLGALSDRGLIGRLASVVVVLAIAWSGVSLWFMCIGR